jgi:hypothetical protein
VIFVDNANLFLLKTAAVSVVTRPTHRWLARLVNFRSTALVTVFETRVVDWSLRTWVILIQRQLLEQGLDSGRFLTR